MSENESKSLTPITLTAEQIISLVGHGVTQEQLDSARRELGEKIDESNKDINNKIDSNYKDINNKIDSNYKELNTKIDTKFDRLDDKIDKKFNLILAFLLASVAGIVALGFWLGQNVIK